MVVTETVLVTDVLVIGGGLAGCLAAIRAREKGANVILVEQRKSGYCGDSVTGMHIFRFLHPEDDLSAALEETVTDSEYMVDQECIEAALKETWDRFQDLQKLGARFRKDDAGEIEFRKYETDTPIFQYKYAAFEPMASYKHLLNITKAVSQRGVKILDSVTVVDLITSNGAIHGAFGFNTLDGTFYVLKASAVVLANVDSAGPMALRAGAELKGMELGGFAVAPKGPPTFMQRGLRPEPEYLITNGKGEEYLNKYEETRRIPGRVYSGAPWRRQTRVTLREWMEGNGPTFCEFVKPKGTTFSSLIREYWGTSFDKQLKWFEDRGYTALGTLKYELTPFGRFGIGTSHRNSKVNCNINCETKVPGLFAAGSATWGWGAVGYTITGGGLTNAAVQGHRAGESAAQYVFNLPKIGTDTRDIISLKNKTFAPLGHRGVTADEISIKLLNTQANIDIRSESTLQKAIAELKQLEEDAENLSANDYHELQKCHRIRTLLIAAQATASSALVRRETRQGHIRLDYPLTDNKNWLKWTITRLIGSEIHTDLENIPIGRWKYRPEPIIYDPARPVAKEARS